MAALISAALQASVHGVWKAAGDKLVIRAVIGCVEAVLVLPFLCFLPLPSVELWGWLILSVSVHLVYQIILIEAYNNLDFSVAYPLARGMAPVAAALLGVAFLGDSLSPGSLIGILLVTCGLVILTLGVRLRWVGLLSALSAGLLTSIYSVIDAQGARLAVNVSTFIVWFFLLEGAGILLIAFWRRGPMLPARMRAEGVRGLVGGGLSAIGYASALAAFRLAPVGAVSALRETSVVFATLFAVLVLKERPPIKRFSGIAVIICGALLIALSATADTSGP